MNTHNIETINRNLPPDFIDTDAPDPRLSLLSLNETSPQLAAAAAKDTAAVFCALLIEQSGRWHAGLAFEQFYVSPEWVQHLLAVLRNADLRRFAANLWESSSAEGRLRLDEEPRSLALALCVRSAGREEAHLICEAGQEPSDWRLLLRGVMVIQSQNYFCGTLTYLGAFLGKPEYADWVAEYFCLQVGEAS